MSALAAHATRFDWTPAGAGAEAVAGTLDPDVLATRSPEKAQAMQQAHAAGNGPEGWRDLMRTAGEFVTTLPDEGVTDVALRRTDFPVLVSRCVSDELVTPEESQRVAGLIPHGLFRAFTEGNHAFHTVPTAPFIDTVIRFFDSSGGGSP